MEELEGRLVAVPTVPEQRGRGEMVEAGMAEVRPGADALVALWMAATAPLETRGAVPQEVRNSSWLLKVREHRHRKLLLPGLHRSTRQSTCTIAGP